MFHKIEITRVMIIGNKNVFQPGDSAMVFGIVDSDQLATLTAFSALAV
jgi:hypothetical protein